jgi:hypothetical protein
MMIVWTDYMKHRVRLRGFDLAKIERIVRHSTERYSDTVTGRLIIVGRHDEMLVMIPCEAGEASITPIAVHATTRQQVNLRLKTGRFSHE